MFFQNAIEPTYQVYQGRRAQLVQEIKKSFSGLDRGLILLFGGFEKHDVRFVQESSFYYFTGIEEAGMVLAIDIMASQDGASYLFVPSCIESKKKWMGSAIGAEENDAHILGFEAIELLGAKLSGLNIYPYFEKESYENLLTYIAGFIKNDASLFVLYPGDSYQYVEQKFVFDRMRSLLVTEIFDKKINDISEVVAGMRRKKDIFEIGKISESISLTAFGHDSAARVIKDGVLESEVQAGVEYIFTAACAQKAFPSIVASGKNGTVLHYHTNCDEMRDGDLVIVDIGAKLDYYCADITRTYPISGVFSERQREIYTVVLETQAYIAGLVKPGYYLKNEDERNKSLTHLALEFLKKRGYEKYFTHGIGHFLGLDVHDVGSLQLPLQEGDVITIEPGIYIPEEGIGIRIEDDYWITASDAICLTDMLPKELDEIEQFMKIGLQDSNSIDM